MTDTERYILSALLADYGSTKDLCRKTREKMELLLKQYVQYINISKTDYGLVQAHLRAFLSFPSNNLGLEKLDFDQPPPAPHSALPAWVKEAARLSDDVPLPQLADSSRDAL